MSETNSDTVTLSARQIEEIHADEYSLNLFHATRYTPLSLLEIKRQFPEPSAKKADLVMSRFVEAGLVTCSAEEQFYTCYPGKYLNYGSYRYDTEIEGRKDRRIFLEMKENFNNPAHWEDRAYYSIDSFFTKEQTMELRELFMQIRQKSKEFSAENQSKGKLKGLLFRRLKFYDMAGLLLVVMALSFSFIQPSYAGGNDPHRSAYTTRVSGNDPHRPATLTDECYGNVEASCKLMALRGPLAICKGDDSAFCRDVRQQAKTLLQVIKGDWEI